MTPLEVIAGTFPDTECKDYRRRSAGEVFQDSNVHVSVEAIR